MFYLSTQTIKRAFEILTSQEFNDPNTIHYFLIMKACGINKITYETPNFTDKNGLYYASRISSLFTPEETQPKKYGFINPFSMRSWPSQPISEPLTKWITSRLKNNILGGGMQWRSILDLDTRAEDKKVKFKYDYINIIKGQAFDTAKVNLFAIAVWSNRFSQFKNKVTLKEVCDEFIKSYKLDIDEINAFFNTKDSFDLEFSEEMYDAMSIRNLIGNVPSETWSATNLTDHITEDFVLSSYDFNALPTDVQEVNVPLIQFLLNDYNQLILSGPPGTSKSFYCSKIAEDYDEVIHVQFHPQYTYQSFVGGYVVEKAEVIFKNGVILNLINETTFSPDKKYLIIIDEFNRANVSQVLGEVIQCLDRNQSVEIMTNSGSKTISIPKNIHILATMNTTDRTLGAIDYAVKRRFLNVYCPANPNLLIDLCPSEGFISLCDFLTKLNKNLVRVTGNRDYCIGHAMFLSDNVKANNKFVWNFDTFRVLYNYKILPVIEDYCSNNREMIEDAVGNKLSSQLDAESFKNAIAEFMEM